MKNMLFVLLIFAKFTLAGHNFLQKKKKKVVW